MIDRRQQPLRFSPHKTARLWPEEHSSNPLSHVVDQNTLELPGLAHSIELPFIGWREQFFIGTKNHALSFQLGFQITRFMVMQVVAACLVALIVIPLARHIAKHRVTRGRWMNVFEVLVLFIRDKVARPSIDGDDHGHEEHGHEDLHDAHGTAALAHSHARASDKFLPFLLTLFFFILMNNLLGMIPGGASATASINVTGILALFTLGAVLTAGIQAMGVKGFLIGIVPKMDVPAILKPPLFAMMWVIEIVGLLIKHFVLSVRLFANMLAGHIVLAVILGFVLQAPKALSVLVTPASIFGGVAISMLELFVAFLQAYIFTFLAALFIGSAAHPH